jgi:excisionase family DNA binding protein
MLTDEIEPSEKLLNRVEAAWYLGVTTNTLRTWATRKRDVLPYRRVGHKVQYSKKDLDNYIRTRMK